MVGCEYKPPRLVSWGGEWLSFKGFHALKCPEIPQAIETLPRNHFPKPGRFFLETAPRFQRGLRLRVQVSAELASACLSVQGAVPRVHCFRRSETGGGGGGGGRERTHGSFALVNRSELSVLPRNRSLEPWRPDVI